MMRNVCMDQKWIIELNKSFMRELDKQGVQVVTFDDDNEPQHPLDGEREPDIGGYDE